MFIAVCSSGGVAERSNAAVLKGLTVSSAQTMLAANPSRRCAATNRYLLDQARAEVGDLGVVRIQLMPAGADA